jgi:glycosyltransferase involved in cell wall biosynthesis
MARLQDHRANILFVGRIVPNKRFEDLIYTFKFWLEFDPEARLFLVGGSEVSSFYLECLQELARRLRVDHAVHFVGRVDDGQLNAYYRCASMFWCFSRHEGFCAPLIEAMWFDVPVVAVRSSAVGETMQNAGLMVEPGMRPDALAAMIHKRLADPPSRKALVQGQRARRTSFLPDAVERHLRHLVTRIGA